MQVGRNVVAHSGVSLKGRDLLPGPVTPRLERKASQQQQQHQKQVRGGRATEERGGK